MDNTGAELDRIREILKYRQKGLTIAEIAKQLDLNRISTSKYLNMLVASGQAEMRIHGPSKVFYPCQRVPISTILNFSTSLLFVMDNNLTITDVNNAVLNFFSSDKKEFIGHRIDFSPIAGYIDSTILTRIQNALESHESTLEVKWERDGTDRFVYIKFIPTVFDTGDHGVALIAEDITELSRYRQHLEQLVDERSEELLLINNKLRKEIENHKKARRALKLSEAKYRTVLENSNEAIVVIQDGNIKYINPRTLAMIHTTVEKLKEHPFTDYIHPDDREMIIARYRQRILDEDIPLRNDVRLISEENQVIWVQIAAVRIEWEGRLATLYFLADITERKHVEEQLKFQNALLTSQQETILDGILVVDGKGNILSYNQNFVKLWEIPYEVIARKNGSVVLQCMKDKVAKSTAFLKKVNYLNDNRNEISRDEIALKDGRSFDRYSAPMLGSDGEYYGRVWYFRNIRERKSAQEN